MSPVLSSTLSGTDFNSVFQEVQHQNKLGLRNGEDLPLFHLNVRNNQFTYTDLEQFVRHNVGQYVFSRAKIADYLY